MIRFKSVKVKDRVKSNFEVITEYVIKKENQINDYLFTY